MGSLLMAGSVCSRDEAFSPRPILCGTKCSASDVSAWVASGDFRLNVSKTLVFLPNVLLLLCINFLLMAFLTS